MKGDSLNGWLPKKWICTARHTIQLLESDSLSWCFSQQRQMHCLLCLFADDIAWMIMNLDQCITQIHVISWIYHSMLILMVKIVFTISTVRMNKCMTPFVPFSIKYLCKYKTLASVSIEWSGFGGRHSAENNQNEFRCSYFSCTQPFEITPSCVSCFGATSTSTRIHWGGKDVQSGAASNHPSRGQWAMIHTTAL